MYSPCAPCWAFASVRACGTFPTGVSRQSPRWPPIHLLPRCWASASGPILSVNNGAMCYGLSVRSRPVMLRKLAAYERQNQLDVALQKIGKDERTLFMLDCLENPNLRRRCQARLTNNAKPHAFTKAQHTFRQVPIIVRNHETQKTT